GRVLVGLGPAITPIRDRRENELDATILHLRQHIVEKIEMFVFQQVAGRVTDLCIPYMNAISIEAQTGKMIYIGIDRFPQRHAKTLCRTISMGEGGGIVYAEGLNFLACIEPAHRAVLVEYHITGPRGRTVREPSDGHVDDSQYSCNQTLNHSQPSYSRYC